MSVHQLAPYQGSRDYARLVKLAKQHSIICILDYRRGKHLRRDVASTFFDPRPGRDPYWSVVAPGTCHISAFSEQEFVSLCEAANLEFLEPPHLEPESP